VDRWNGSKWKPYQYTFFNESRVIGVDGVERDLAPGYDAAGLLVRYRYTVYDKNGDATMFGDYYTTFIGFSSWKEQHIFVSINRGTPGNTAMEYSARGDLLSATATGNTVFTRRYASDRNGQLIMRTEGNNTSAQTYVMHNGNVLASVGNNSTPEIYDTIASISPNEMERAPTNYVIVDGDTLQNIAQKIWGDSSMWYLIADANGLSASSALERGTTLTIPNIAGSHSNNADTFKAYDANEVSGDLTPAAKFKPPKPKKKKSGGLGSIVMVVVAVVAAVFTAGAALAAIGVAGTAAGATVGGLASAAWAGGVTALTTGTFAAGTLGTAMAAGAIGGAVGSAAGQLAGMSMGVVDSFSWSQVAVGALTGGITGGIGHLAQASNIGWVKAAGEITSGGAANANPWQVASAYAAKGVSDFAAGQIANRVVGLDTSFSWRAVAASAAGAAVGGVVGKNAAQWGRTGKILGDQVGAHASAVMSDKWFGGARPNYGQVATDAFGNSLGNWIVDEMRAAGTRERLAEWTDGELTRARARVEDAFDRNALEFEQSSQDFASWGGYGLDPELVGEYGGNAFRDLPTARRASVAPRSAANPLSVKARPVQELVASVDASGMVCLAPVETVYPTGIASPIKGSYGVGAIKRFAQMAGVGDLFPTTLTLDQERGVGGKILNFLGINDTAQNYADIEAYRRHSVLGTDLTYGQLTDGVEWGVASLGVLAGGIGGAKLFTRAPDTVSVDLFRKTANTGEFSGLKVPMQMRYVKQAAFEGGVGMQGVKVRIVRDPDLIGKDLYGYTHPNGSIDLYPDAFTNIEQLVKTLGHERTHTMQIDLYGHPNRFSNEPLRMNQELRLNEGAAHGIEDSFWQYYQKNKTGQLGGFE
ncbi:LysM domain-containing protein, partial [Pseudomonas sp. GD04042]